jgi:OOP family OmpA-OmpF porin
MRILGGVSAVLVCLAPSEAFTEPPNDRAIDVQMFEYAIGPKTFLTVSDGDVAMQKQLAVDALITYLTKPFSIYNYDPENPDMVGTERTTVVESLAAAQLTAAYGITDRFQVGVNLPIIFSLSGEGLNAMNGRPADGGLSVTGLGDLLVEGKYRLYKQDKLKISGAAGVSLPSSFGSSESQFIGDNLPTMRAKLALQVDAAPRVSFGANAGLMLRKPRTIYDSTIGQQLTWGVAGTVRITERLSVIAETYGRAGLPDFSLDASPLEAVGGLRLYATNAVAVVLGGGAGILKGIGSPESRFFLSVGYAPDVRDSDGDGIPNGRDKCTLVPEDKDGVEDDDGCPDDDNDGDRRMDAEDKCPAEPEDIDGFEDDDGCPELDNDKDGIADLQDKCINDAEDGKEPNPKDGCPANKRDSDADGVSDAADACPTAEEDMDGFDDGDGCPDLDNDGDGVPDTEDKCSLCPEDRDSFEDADGCPDLDNDKDGIADAADSCPLEAETLNGVKDDDGCPDTGGVGGVKLDGDRLMVDVAPKLARNGLAPAGAQIVDQIALVMKAHDEVTKWLVAVGQPKEADAKKLADAIKARLVAKGVPEDRLSVLGAVGAAKIGGVVQERAPADAPFVCPAGLEVQPRGGPAPAAKP